jgi:hypothetical protein
MIFLEFLKLCWMEARILIELGGFILFFNLGLICHKDFNQFRCFPFVIVI